MCKHLLSIVLVVLTVLGCKSNTELSMERGEYYYNTNQLEIEMKKKMNKDLCWLSLKLLEQLVPDLWYL